MHGAPSSVVAHAMQVISALAPLVKQVERRDRYLASQLRRAASSVPLNLSEGFGVHGGNARLRFETALGSASETLAALQIAVVWGYLDAERARPVTDLLERLCRRIFGLARR